MPQYLLTNEDYVQVQKTLYCTHNQPLVSTVFANCVSSLYFNSKSDVKKYCDFKFIINTIEPTILQVLDTALLVYKKTHFHLTVRINTTL